MSGLLDGLRTFFLGDDGQLHEVHPEQTILFGPWLRASDVRDLLRSDETVEACARAVHDERMRLGEVTLGEWEEILHDTRTALAVLAGDDQ